MKVSKTLNILFLMTALIGCKKSVDKEYTYEFLNPYCAKINVGGIVGISEKCYKIGDQVKGRKLENGVVPIRIAPSSKDYKSTASSASFQEFVDVPSINLRLILDE